MKCPRCIDGCLHWNFEEWACINCGHRLIELRTPEPDALMKSGAKLPVVSEVKR